MPVEPLSQKDIEERLHELPGWSFAEDRIVRSYRLESHFAAAAMAVHVARIQEELDHHSELTLSYHGIALAVQTHDAGGAVTEKDFALARRVEDIAPVHGAN